jgi:RNA polymerase sigma-70 factor (ECF subfamily)
MVTIAALRSRPVAQERTVPGDFDALFLAHYQAVFRLAYRLAGTREEAEDLAQETFARLHATPRLWGAADGALRGWLYRVATNLAYNSARSQGRRKRREDAVFAAQVADSSAASSAGTDPAELAERTEQRVAVRAALLRLPERQAQLLLLRHAGLSYKELAEALGIAPGSVGTLLARAEAAFERAYRAGGDQ